LLGLDLQNLLVCHDSEADALDEVILESNLELDELLDTLNQFNLVSMFTLAVALNHQLLGMGDDFQADKAALSICRLDLLDRRRQVAIVGEGSFSELGRLMTIVQGEAK